MSIQRLVCGGGGALLGGLLGMFVGGPAMAVWLAPTIGVLGLNICSTTATDQLKERTVSNLTGLVDDTPQKCSDSPLKTVDHTGKTTPNSVAQSLESLAYTTNTATAVNMLIPSIVAGGLYWIVSRDLDSRCVDFPAGCYVLTLIDTSLLTIVAIGIGYIFYCAGSRLKGAPKYYNITQQVQLTYGNESYVERNCLEICPSKIIKENYGLPSIETLGQKTSRPKIKSN